MIYSYIFLTKLLQYFNANDNRFLLFSIWKVLRIRNEKLKKFPKWKRYCNTNRKFCCKSFSVVHHRKTSQGFYLFQFIDLLIHKHKSHTEL